MHIHACPIQMNCGQMAIEFLIHGARTNDEKKHFSYFLLGCLLQISCLSVKDGAHMQHNIDLLNR